MPIVVTIRHNTDTTMKAYPNLLKSGPVSPEATGHSVFEFPIAISAAIPNDVVFCGKFISRQTEPGSPPQRPEYSIRTNGFAARLRSPSGGENWYRRIGSGCRKRYNGMFGTVKFPLQMELSDIKIRQERKEKMPLPKLPATAVDGGGESFWELVRPLRRRGTLMSALAKASFRCIPIV